MGFCKDFAWGAATAAVQVEGAAYEDGKAPSLWDVYARYPGAVYRGQNADTACDHYHRFQEDVALMKRMGLTAYRYSISWPRVLPQGTGEVNQKGLDFYDRLLDALLEAGIEPYLTLFHWDYPYALYQKGGWMNPDSSDWFAAYADRITRRYGDRVKHFITINEPECFVGAFESGDLAPFYRVHRRDYLQMAHNALLGHGKAVQAVRANCPGAACGFAATNWLKYPITDEPENVELARKRCFELNEPTVTSFPWWTEAVYLGRYPAAAVAAAGPDMPVIGQNDMALISQPLDFFGMNHYTGIPVAPDGTQGDPVFSDNAPRSTYDWPLQPRAFYYAAKFMYERYGLPILVTENGYSGNDLVSADGKVHDAYRIEQLSSYLKALRRAADEGVPVLGYFHWALMDNFEWAQGYGKRFGLAYVNFDTQERILKDSGEYYRKIIESNGDIL